MIEEAGPRTDEGAVRHAEEGVEERAARARVPGGQGGHAGPEIGRVGPGGRSIPRASRRSRPKCAMLLASIRA